MEFNSKISEALGVAMDILSSKNVSVVVTGTTGLCLLGFVPEGYVPNDIDLKIKKSQVTDKLKEWFIEQEKIQGIKRNPDYKNECYTLIIKGVSVNIIVSEDDIVYSCFINAEDNTAICVEHPMNILKEKDMLNRPKDKDFFISLINRLTSIYQ